jgi:zinc transport system substrate-binding protein
VKRLLLLTAVFALACSGCMPGNRQVLQTTPESSLLKIYTTVFPVYDFTKKIGGDKVIVENIMPLGASPHSFEPSTRLVAALSKARLIIKNGAGLEPYMDKLAATLPQEVTVVDSSQGIQLLELHPEAEHPPEAHGHHEEHHHGEYDPHIWLSPQNALKQGENILHALQKMDPEHKEYYLRNYQSFRQEISELDSTYRETLLRCEKKELIVTHAAFAYLCRDYGLTQVSVMGINAESEPTPGKMRDIVEYIRDKGITHIYFEPMESSKAAQAIAAEAKIQVLPLNPFGGITATEQETGEDYFGLMKKNLESLRKGLNYR